MCAGWKRSASHATWANIIRRAGQTPGVQISNLTEERFVLPGLTLHARERIRIAREDYLWDEPFRLQLNQLYADGKVSVEQQPKGFPVA
jgi:hypothetical protein